MSKLFDAKLLCYKFDFEVPLEDLFPQNQLHPKIEVMYYQTLKCFKKTNATYDTMFNNTDNNSAENVRLKQMMLDAKDLQGSPQSFLWLIEHFLGMLPIPLMPVYCNSRRFRWLYLSQKCKNLFQIYRNQGHMDYRYDFEIANEISKLPPQHILLLNLHLSLIRQISFLSKNKHVWKRNMIYYTKYFTSSIFLRPFRSGLEQAIEREYYFILLYMILRWPFIQSLCPLRMLQEQQAKIGQQVKYELGTNTKNYLSTKSNNVNLNLESLIKQKCCCSLGSNYTNNSWANVPQDRLEITSSQLETDSTENDVEKCKTVVTEPVGQNSEPCETADDESFIYDDYDTFKQEKYNQIRDINYPEVKTECPMSKTNESNDAGIKMNNELEINVESTPNHQEPEEDLVTTDKSSDVNFKKGVIDSTYKLEEYSTQSHNPITIDTNVMKRVTKLGWTYTPKKTCENKDLNYPSKDLTDEITNEKLLSDFQNELNIKKYPSMKSLKSKLSFFKIGKKYNENKSNLKYTKINS